MRSVGKYLNASARVCGYDGNMKKLVAALILTAQIVAAQTTIKVTTRMVEVNVIVRDKDGPISGLTKEGLNFTKTVQGGSAAATIRVLIFDRNSGRLGTLTLPAK